MLASACSKSPIIIFIIIITTITTILIMTVIITIIINMLPHPYLSMLHVNYHHHHHHHHVTPHLPQHAHSSSSCREVCSRVLISSSWCGSLPLRCILCPTQYTIIIIIIITTTTTTIIIIINMLPNTYLSMLGLIQQLQGGLQQGLDLWHLMRQLAVEVNPAPHHHPHHHHHHHLHHHHHHHHHHQHVTPHSPQHVLSHPAAAGMSAAGS